MISHQRRCVFVHIPKCGGVSIEQVFVRDLGLSWENRAPLLLRPRVEGEDAPLRLAHLTAREYVEKRYLSRELFDEYLTFTVVRDPLKRTSSFYRYLGYDQVMSFADFVDRHLPRVLARPGHPMHWFLRPQSEFVTGEGGEVLVDTVLHLEDLDETFPAILDKLGMDPAPLPHVNKTNTMNLYQATKIRLIAPYVLRAVPRVGTRQEVVWEDRLVARVGDLYARDFELFDYSLDYPVG